MPDVGVGSYFIPTTIFQSSIIVQRVDLNMASTHPIVISRSSEASQSWRHTQKPQVLAAIPAM